MYYIPLILTIIANVLYHIAQKNTPEKINPMFSLMITYGIALFISIIIFFICNKSNSIIINVKQLNWSSILLGVSIVLLELGFLLAYRAGWNIGTASIISTIIVTITLIPFGIIFYREQISKINVLGIIISIIGIILINKK